ncbi:MAG TPA: MarR family transcriptional regulator, partial [Burkholderiales bacterium]|nr:MarR family transcriptional regulator [Burkholderiales bacterium]
MSRKSSRRSGLQESLERSSRRSRLQESLERDMRLLSVYTVLFNKAVADRLEIHVTDPKCASLLDLGGAMSAGQLADLTGLTSGAITGVIDRLEQAGLVGRRASPNDRRQVIVEALPHCCPRISSQFSGLCSSMSDIVSRYSEDELDIVHDFTSRIVDSLREET